MQRNTTSLLRWNLFAAIGLLLAGMSAAAYAQQTPPQNQPQGPQVVQALDGSLVVQRGDDQGCRTELKRYCHDDQLGSRIACLNKHADRLSSACAALLAPVQVLVPGIGVVAEYYIEKDGVQGCKAEIKQLCQAVPQPPTNSALKACLKTNAASLSPACAALLTP